LRAALVEAVRQVLKKIVRFAGFSLSPALSVFISPTFPRTFRQPIGLRRAEAASAVYGFPKAHGEHCGSKREERHEAGTRDRLRYQPRYRLGPSSGDHDRVPEKNRALESVLEGAQRGTFLDSRILCSTKSASSWRAGALKKFVSDPSDCGQL